MERRESLVLRAPRDHELSVDSASDRPVGVGAPKSVGSPKRLLPRPAPPVATRAACAADPSAMVRAPAAKLAASAACAPASYRSADAQTATAAPGPWRRSWARQS